MKLHPFYEVTAQAEEYIARGATCYEQFLCANCGTKQTMEEPNTFYTKGKCQECGHITDIEADGANILLAIGKEIT